MTDDAPTDPCYRDGDGEPHDEAFYCDVCDRPVCGYCADPGNGSEWFCPDCVGVRA